MGVVRLAIPAILGLVLVEAAVARRRGRPAYLARDTLTSFGCATLSQIANLAVAALTVGAYALTQQSVGSGWWGSLDWPGWASWSVVFLLVDLGQYATHRWSHRISILWAGHAVHHSSEEMNLAVGLRQSSTHGFFVWVFFLPGAVAGIPWHLVATSYGINVLYQFGLHTRQIGRLGWLEWIFNTPSHHRVHHGSDGKYRDRNYGGVLIVWDRLFGTFQAEEEEPRYGLTTPVGSASPLWTNLHGYTLIAATWRRSGGWRDRIRAVLGPPEALYHGASAPPPVVSRLTRATPRSS